MPNYVLKSWADLTTNELYQLLRLRCEVFIVEQDCPYQDLDDKDYHCHHVLGFDADNTIIAHARIVPKGISYADYVSIGRVVNSPSIRRTGEGRKLFAFALAECRRLYPTQLIKISAQTYLLNFYSSFSFKPIGEEYLEDNLPHRAMVYDKRDHLD